MSVYLTPPVSGDLCAFLGKPNGARWLTGDSNGEAKAFAKSVGLKGAEAYRPGEGLRARLDHYPLDFEQAKAAIAAGAIEETFDEYRARVERRGELLDEKAKETGR